MFKSPQYYCVTIDIFFQGAEKIVTVDSSIAKDEVFTDISENGEQSVTISQDSAYTVCFDVENYKHYTNPAINFNVNLPAGTTIIMMDFSEGSCSYWSYTVPAGGVDSVLLENFIRMGTVGKKYAIGDRSSLTLQFVIDFSNCSSNIAAGSTLVTSFKANPKAGTVPNMPDASGQTNLASKPNFVIEVSQNENTLSQTVSYEYAYNVTPGIGVSKWERGCGILVIEPKNPNDLPPDARLQVVIDGFTETYYLVNGKFVVAIPSVGMGRASITLLSDMFPNATKDFKFSIALYSSETGVKNTSAIVEQSAEPDLTITFNTKQTVKPAIHAKITGKLPECIIDASGKTAISDNLEFTASVNLKEMPQGYQVNAALYAKNANGGYTFTTYKLSNLDMTKGKFTFDMSSFAGVMTEPGSLSLMLRIEIVDSSGQVVNSLPLYFILLDTRQ